MPKTKISEFSATPANNTDIDSINIAEGCAPSGINDAIRELMAQLKDFQTGAVGDSFNGPVGTSTAAAGAFTTLAASGAVTLSGGTANGVAYLNGSKVVTSGSALTYSGTNLSVDAAGSGPAYLEVSQRSRFGYDGTNVFISDAGTGKDIVFTRISEQMRLTSTGLGIGTSSPSQKLEVSGAIRATITPSNSVQASLLLANSGTTSAANLQLNTSGGLAVWNYQNGGVGWFNSATIDTSGNLGLGVTPSAWGSQVKALQSNNGVYFGAFQGGATPNLYLGTNNYFNGTNWIYSGSYEATKYEQLEGRHAWFNAPSGTAGNAISFTQAMTLDASGRLGIGATSPSSYTTNSTALVIASSTATSYSATAIQAAPIATLYGGGGSGNATGVRLSQGGSFELFFGGVQEAGGAGAFVFQGYSGSAYAERARIDSSGRLIVGTTNAGYGLFGATQRVTVNPINDGIVVAPIGQNLSAYTTQADNNTGTRYAMYIANGSSTPVGNISFTSSATSYNTSSDYRLKNTIAPMTGALAKVALLKPCTYKWNADGSDGQGFIAHELAEVVPQCVTGEKDAVDANGKIKPQSIDTSFLVATLTAAIQEQQAIIESLKARLDAANL